MASYSLTVMPHLVHVFVSGSKALCSFLRSFSLPDAVDRDNIDASFKDGVLTVTLPKTAEAVKQQKKIEVKAG